MKSITTILAILAAPIIAQTQITTPAPYCSGAFDNQNGTSTNYISSVSIGSLENETGTTPSAGGHYLYYNNIDAPVLTKGDEYTMTVNANNAVDMVGHFLAVYIDFNSDDDFEDAGERVMHFDYISITQENEATIEIPTTASTGITRMRVILIEDDDYTWIDGNEEASPCTTYENGLLDWGETEDYDVNIQVAADVEESISNTLICYPNPTSDQLNLKLNADNATYTIYNNIGAIVASGRVSYQSIINVEALHAGFYMLEVNTGKEKMYQTFLKTL